MDLINHNRIQELIDNGYNFDTGGYISEGFDITKREVGLFMGFTLVYFLISMAASFIPMASILIGPPLIAGFFIAGRKTDTNQVLDFGDFFKGFDYFGQLIIQQLILGLIIIVLFIPFFILMFGGIAIIDGGGGGGPVFAIIAILAVLLMFAGLFYAVVSYAFAPLFIVFGNMQAWDAMEASRKIVSKNFFSVLGLVLLMAIINLGGALLCGVGLFYTMPATYNALYASFKDIMQMDLPEEGSNDILHHLVD